MTLRPIAAAIATSFLALPAAGQAQVFRVPLSYAAPTGGPAPNFSPALGNLSSSEAIAFLKKQGQCDWRVRSRRLVSKAFARARSTAAAYAPSSSEGVRERIHR